MHKGPHMYGTCVARLLEHRNVSVYEEAKPDGIPDIRYSSVHSWTDGGTCLGWSMPTATVSVMSYDMIMRTGTIIM